MSPASYRAAPPRVGNDQPYRPASAASKPVRGRPASSGRCVGDRRLLRRGGSVRRAPYFDWYCCSSCCTSACGCADRGEVTALVGRLQAVNAAFSWSASAACVGVAAARWRASPSASARSASAAAGGRRGRAGAVGVVVVDPAVERAAPTVWLGSGSLSASARSRRSRSCRRRRPAPAAGSDSRSTRGLHVQRLDVEERVADRQRQQVAVDHRRLPPVSSSEMSLRDRARSS